MKYNFLVKRGEFREYLELKKLELEYKIKKTNKNEKYKAQLRICKEIINNFKEIFQFDGE